MKKIERKLKRKEFREKKKDNNKNDDNKMDIEKYGTKGRGRGRYSLRGRPYIGRGFRRGRGGKEPISKKKEDLDEKIEKPIQLLKKKKKK